MKHEFRQENVYFGQRSFMFELQILREICLVFRIQKYVRKKKMMNDLR